MPAHSPSFSFSLLCLLQCHLALTLPYRDEHITSASLKLSRVNECIIGDGRTLYDNRVSAAVYLVRSIKHSLPTVVCCIVKCDERF